MGKAKDAMGSDPLEALDAEGLASLLSGKEASATVRAETTPPESGGNDDGDRTREGGDPVDRGRAALDRGDPSTARAAFEEALDSGNRVAALIGLADVHAARGERDAVVKRLEEAASAAPDDVEVAIRLGRARIEATAYEAAEEILKRAIRLAPESAGARCEMGILMTKKGLYDRALDPLNRAIELDPELARAHFYAGVCHNARDRLDDAVSAFERAVEIDPVHGRAWYHLGIVHDRLGAVDRAREMYRRARSAEGASS